MSDLLQSVHGGTDALGVPRHDFSTNRNACGPCPQVVAALQAAHAEQYPDPAYAELRQRLADFHGVDVARVVLAASASEFIHRISAHAARTGLRQVVLPGYSYGDYAQAAQVWGLDCVRGPVPEPALHWACEPSSPLGQVDPALSQWCAQSVGPESGGLRVVDCAYQPLRLDGRRSRVPQDVWQVWTPNKALGMTGVRAAYALAPADDAAMAQVAALRALAPSWVVGAHGVALLQAWTTPAVQHWLALSRRQLADWKDAQIALCASFGWRVESGSLANYFVAHWPSHVQAHMPERLAWLRRAHGIKLRDTSSFGLPGAVRLGVLPPASQDALAQAWQSLPHLEKIA